MRRFSCLLVLLVSFAIAPSAGASEAVLTLESAGSEPRQVLRVTPVVGQTESSKVTMAVAMRMSMSGMEMPEVRMPLMLISGTSKVESVGANGDIVYRLAFTKADVQTGGNLPEEMRQQLSLDLQALVGVTGSVTMTSRGFSTKAKMTVPKGTPKDARELINDMSETLSDEDTPLPAEAVGVGASWTVVSTITSDEGLQIEETTRYELASISGSTVQLTSAISHEPTSTKVDLDGMKLQLAKYSGSGVGAVTLDLTRVTPVVSQENLSTALEASGTEGTFTIATDVSLVEQSEVVKP
ncbi:MAG: hypothetical protein KDA24_03210 [Deltaproteobacteria bacterium]|nr:hypothetical protein [Deltaproteobacteria bacterium]